jgi:hypothetical protein
MLSYLQSRLVVFTTSVTYISCTSNSAYKTHKLHRRDFWLCYEFQPVLEQVSHKLVGSQDNELYLENQVNYFAAVVWVANRMRKETALNQQHLAILKGYRALRTHRIDLI